MAMSPYSVHPVFTAMAAATLDEMHPGRVIQLPSSAWAHWPISGAAGLSRPRKTPRNTHRGDRAVARAVCRRACELRGSAIAGAGAAPRQRGAQDSDRARRIAAQHAGAGRRGGRRRADLGGDGAGLQHARARAGRPRQARPAGHSASLRSSTRKLARARRLRWTASGARWATCCAARTMPRTSDFPVRRLDQAALCVECLRGRRLGASRAPDE